MPLLQPSWHSQLRSTTAIPVLDAGNPHEFPIAEAQQIIDKLLQRQASPLPLPLPGAATSAVQPHTTECDIYLATEITEHFGDECPGRAAAVIACLHVLTYDGARALMCSVRPWRHGAGDAGTSSSSANLDDIVDREGRLGVDLLDEFFEKRVLVYLQCLYVARNITRDLCTEVETEAAWELFRVVRGKARGFRCVGRLLPAVGSETVEELLPLDFVRTVMRRSAFARGLMRVLEDLAAHQRWALAWERVSGLRDVVREGNQTVKELLRDAFPGYLKWALWRPDVGRITAWRSEAVRPYRHRLAQVFELEGPDTTIQQRVTLRQSSSGPFTMLAGPDVAELLDRLLNTLDRAIQLGPKAIEVFLLLCIENGNVPSRQSLDRVDPFLRLGTSATSKKVLDMLQSMNPRCPPFDRARAVASALPIFQESLTLRETFAATDLASQATNAMSRAQREFCYLASQQKVVESHALAIYALGQSLLLSTWLHSAIDRDYLALLRKLPSEPDLLSTFPCENQTSRNPIQRRAEFDLITKKLASNFSAMWPPIPSRHESDPSPYPPSSPSPAHSTLSTILQTHVPRLPRDLATACVRQSRAEPDTFIHNLGEIFRSSGSSPDGQFFPTDRMCVDLAVFLAARLALVNTAANTATTRTAATLHPCWSSLLQHLMLLRSPGLLDSCARTLPEASWNRWVASLRRLYGERLLSGGGGGPPGLGFTAEAVAAWTARKIGVGRNLSGSSTESGSSVDDGVAEDGERSGGRSGNGRLVAEWGAQWRMR